MKKPSQVRDWFDANDPAQVGWAKQYWTNKARADLSARMHGLHAQTTLEWLAESAEGRELLTKMRRAWNTHKSKAKSERKSYTFVLSATADRQLRALTKGQSKSETLEALIRRGFDFEASLRIERRHEIDKAVAELKAKGQQTTPSLQEVLAKQRVAELREELKELSEVFESTLHENFMLRIRLKDAGIDPDGMPEADQQKRAREEFERRLVWHNLRFGRQRRLFRKLISADDDSKPVQRKTDA